MKYLLCLKKRGDDEASIFERVEIESEDDLQGEKERLCMKYENAFNTPITCELILQINQKD